MPESYNRTTNNGLYLRTNIRITDASAIPNGYTSLNLVQAGKVVDTLNGEKNPRWRAQIRDVVSATTPLNGKKYKFWWTQYPSMRASFYNKVNPEKDKLHFVYSILGVEDSGSGISTFLPTVAVPTPANVTSANNLAIAKLTDKLNELQSLAKVGEDLGEIRQTAKALSNPFKPVRDVVLKSFALARKGLRGRRQPIEIAKDLADAHLEFAFGWKPLANSIASSIVALQNRASIGLYHPFHAKGKLAFDGWNTRASEYIQGTFIVAQFDVQQASEVVVVYQGVWEEKCKLPEKSVNRVLGLTSVDVLPTMWNLIPYSFLADYFTNIGDIVGALNSPWGAVAWCNRTERVETKRRVLVSYVNGLPNSFYGLILQNPGIFDASVTTFTRSVQAARPLPELEFTRLRDITGKQWLNMAALTVSQGAKLALSLGNAVRKHPDLPHMFIEQLARRGGYRDPYPFHRGK